jgi:RPA family protein
MEGERSGTDARMARETAQRVFSKEFNASTVSIRGDDEKSPLYVLTPLGARVNRMVVIGILSECSNRGGDDEPMWNARVMDPVGTFRVMAGRFQAQPTAVLSSIKVIPTYVSIIGKVRTYSPEEGVTYVSIRPEYVTVVDRDAYNYWVIETARQTKARIDAIEDAISLDDPVVESLVKLGHGQRVAMGAIEALRRYKNVDPSYYRMALSDALQVVTALSKGTPPLATPTPIQEGEVPLEEKMEEAFEEEAEAREPQAETSEGRILQMIRTRGKDRKEGVSYNELVDFARKSGISQEDLDACLDNLIATGEIYQPQEEKYRSLS